MSEAEEQTRATCAGTREAPALAVVNIRPLGGPRRTPTALVDVEIDGVTICFSYAHLRAGMWQVRSPRDQQNNPAFIAPDHLHDRIGQLVAEAVQEDEAVTRHLREWRKQRQAWP